MQLVTTISLCGLGIAALLCLAWLVRARSVADRIVALDTFLIVSVMGIAVFAVRTDTGAFIPVLLVAALLAFEGTVTVARFIERRGA